MAQITESLVEQAALDWLSGLGYEVLSELAVAPGEPAAEPTDFKQILFLDRLQLNLAALNPTIAQEGLEEALRKVRLFSHPTLTDPGSVPNFHHSTFTVRGPYSLHSLSQAHFVDEFRVMTLV